MKNNKLKEQITSIIALHYDRELWHSRPEKSYEASIEPFVNDLIKIATYHKRDWQFQSFIYDECELFTPTTTGEKIGDNIRELRCKKGWSREEFAERAGLDVEYLRNVESGEPILRMWALESILDALQVSSASVLPF